QRDGIERDFRDNYLGDQTPRKRGYRGSRLPVKYIRANPGARASWDYRGIRILRTRAHWIAFFPFSAKTWFKSERSYRLDRSGIWRPRKPASNADLAAFISDPRSGSQVA